MASAVYRIPLLNVPQIVSTPIGSQTYTLSTFYAPSPNGEGGWCFNLDNALGVRLLSGIPMVTGQDLLEPFDYMGFDAVLWCATPGDPPATPTETNLGQTAGGNLYYSADV